MASAFGSTGANAIYHEKQDKLFCWHYGPDPAIHGEAMESQWGSVKAQGSTHPDPVAGSTSQYVYLWSGIGSKQYCEILWEIY